MFEIEQGRTEYKARFNVLRDVAGPFWVAFLQLWSRLQPRPLKHEFNAGLPFEADPAESYDTELVAHSDIERQLYEDLK